MLAVRKLSVMKVAILAGGMGTRLAEETDVKPKPMINIGGRPILWHIMRHYQQYGFNDFIIALGYKGLVIKQWINDFPLESSDITVDMGTGDRTLHENGQYVPWTVTCADTGLKTQTGGRIKRLQNWIGNEPFMLTWGDGLSDINLQQLLEFHKSHGKIATVTAVRPQARFGHLRFDGDKVISFEEKPQAAEGWINGAYFVLEPEIFSYIESDSTHFERAPMEQLARDGELMAYRHEGFWQCMDTLRDKRYLERLWESGEAAWKSWS